MNIKPHLPMVATYMRIGLAPLMFVVFSNEWKWAGVFAAVSFMIASLTDWLDGYWARKYNAESTMGKFMDPIADKILVLIALILLLDMQRVDPIMVIILLTRDIFIGGLRSVAAANQVIIAAKPFGKWKTGLQMLGIPMIFIFTPIRGVPIYEIGYALLWGSVALSLVSAIQYSYGYFKSR